jgi:hypothetical protein
MPQYHRSDTVRNFDGHSMAENHGVRHNRTPGPADHRGRPWRTPSSRCRQHSPSPGATDQAERRQNWPIAAVRIRRPSQPFSCQYGETPDGSGVVISRIATAAARNIAPTADASGRRARLGGQHPHQGRHPDRNISDEGPVTGRH